MFGAVQDFTRLSTVVVADDTVLRHPVDHAGRTAVADAHRTLQQTGTTATFPNDNLNRLTSTVDTADRASFHGADTGSAAVPTSVPVRLNYAYDNAGGLAQTSATLFAGQSGQVSDYVIDYQRDSYGRVTQIVQSGTAAAGQPAITRKVVDLAYNRLGGFDSITRNVGLSGSETTVAVSDYSYFDTGYLQEISRVAPKDFLSGRRSRKKSCRRIRNSAYLGQHVASSMG